jgi:hypothetical protein
MKTFFKSIFKFLQSIFLQVILGVIALVAFNESISLGEMFSSRVGTYEKNIIENYEETVEVVGTNIAVDSGYNGGSLSMGLICSVCIIMIVWLEINKKSNK